MEEANVNKKEGHKLEDWMSELPDELHSWPLTKLAIPGSHNSATYDIQPRAACAPDAPANVKQSINIPVLGEAVRAVCHGWAKCQRRTFKEQLESGIRYFDLRITTKADSDEFYFCHTLFGPKLADLLTSVSDFLCGHSKEVVLLDMNHLYSMEEEHHVQLLSLVISHFGDLLMASCDPRDLTLGHMWRHNKQVIVFYHHNLALSFPEVWPSSAITSPWPNTAQQDQCISFLRQCFDAELPHKFLVCQGILTPTTNNFMNLSGNLEKLSSDFEEKFLSFIKERKLRNIIMVDFVSSEFIKTVLSFNHL